MNCTACGNEINPTDKFCGGCGASIAQPATNQPASATVAAPTPVQPTPNPVAPAPQASTQQTSQSMQASYQQIANMPATPMPTQIAGAGAPAQAIPAAHGGETKAIVGFVLSILGVIGSLIPILGLILGITAVVLGSLSRKSNKRGLATASLVIGIVAIVLSLLLFIINLSQIMSEGTNSYSNYSYNIGNLETEAKTIHISELWNIIVNNPISF